ncbi:MAG: tetratricopeptide repeat protein [Cyclobacteriaceae bacterium]|nr:tetratricopeptide repeat protein [Cyclobacteriaceae bacterium HetDA_MAG_MS6]
MNTERVQQLQKFIETDPHDPFAKYALALEYLSENPENSRTLFEELLTIHPDYTATYYHAANLYASLGLREQAEQTFSKGIALTQSNGEHHANRELRNAYQNFLFDEE